MGIGNIKGIVGSNKEYAPGVEEGTGVFAGKARYFPSPAGLEVWAQRHGLPNGFVAALAIYKAGGTRPREFLKKALEKNRDKIKARIGHAITTIVRK
jgi:hypothetical protein